MTITCVAVFGGTGFLGRAIVNRLAAMGATVRVPVRHPGSVKPSDGVAPAGRIASTNADVRDETSVGRALEGCDAAVNAVGLYVERGDETFRAVHELGAMHVARQSYLSVQGAHRTSAPGNRPVSPAHTAAPFCLGSHGAAADAAAEAPAFHREASALSLTADSAGHLHEVSFGSNSKSDVARFALEQKPTHPSSVSRAA